MARTTSIQILRTSLSSLDAQATANGLLIGELYYITDSGHIAVGTSVNTYQIFDKRGLTFYTQTGTAIDGNNGTHFTCSISANASFTFSNLVVGVVYSILVKNTHTASVTVAIPTVNTIRELDSIPITNGKCREFSVIYDGTTYNIEIGNEKVGA